MLQSDVLFSKRIGQEKSPLGIVKFQFPLKEMFKEIAESYAVTNKVFKNRQRV